MFISARIRSTQIPSGSEDPRETGADHGIDLKNPFTMSKTAAAHRAAYRRRSNGSRFFIPGYLISLVALRQTCLRAGGAYRDRTDDLKLAKLALSQLS